uniref:AlNc14C19G2003 protein n=1 Tax=Albugo laibachii Nc14 TaxID=890382 RepID=F0W532_9STRA|nr:AlNc14C19G2003 [Albugo laibachii Nc14]|eukprot:CCA16223.1 AlNc14C19G2003 [Albugo laibachii Nc14]
MVHILNGEIVADNDPRIEAGKQQQQPINRASSNIHTMSYGTVPSTNSETPPVRGEASFCTRMMRNLRLDQSITIPGFRSIRSRQVKIYKIALTALLVFLFGWKILIFIAIGFILSS